MESEIIRDVKTALLALLKRLSYCISKNFIYCYLEIAAPETLKNIKLPLAAGKVPPLSASN